VHVGDAGALANALQDVVQVAGIERATPIGAIPLGCGPGRKQRGADGVGFAAGQVTPKDLAGDRVEWV
jgi:hypothetical protein